MPVILVLGWLRKKYYKFKASLNYIVRSYVKKKKKTEKEKGEGNEEGSKKKKKKEKE
jgi:hypothetical protein